MPAKLPPSTLLLIREPMEPLGDNGWYLDGASVNTLPGLIKTITPTEASTPIAKGGTTIAGHTEHVRWFLARMNKQLAGEKATTPWTESWNVTAVDEASWKKLQNALASEYKTFKSGIEGRTSWTNETLLMGCAAVAPHIAYHLGAIVQMLAAIRAKK